MGYWYIRPSGTVGFTAAEETLSQASHYSRALMAALADGQALMGGYSVAADG